VSRSRRPGVGVALLRRMSPRSEAEELWSCSRLEPLPLAKSTPRPRAEALIDRAPDWRPFAPSAHAVPYRTPQIRLARHERDWFFWLAYSAGLRPGALLRQFAEAFANGASVPRTDLGEPKNKLRLIPPSDTPIPFRWRSKVRDAPTRGRMQTACRSADHAPFRGRLRAERASCAIPPGP
jgi:hypothetical protein